MERVPTLSQYHGQKPGKEKPYDFMLGIANRVHPIEEVVKGVTFPDTSLGEDQTADMVSTQAAKLIRRKLRYNYPVIIENAGPGMVVGIFPHSPQPDRNVTVVEIDRFAHKVKNTKFDNPKFTAQFEKGQTGLVEVSLRIEEHRIYQAPPPTRRREVKNVVINSESSSGSKGFLVFAKDEVLLARIDKDHNLSPYTYYQGGTGWVISGVGLAQK